MEVDKDGYSRGRSTDVVGHPESPLITDSHCRVGYELVTLSIPPATVKLTRVGNESGMWDFTLNATQQCVHCVEGYVYTEIFKEYYLPWQPILMSHNSVSESHSLYLTSILHAVI